MGSRIWRQRRRLFLCMFLAALAGYVSTCTGFPGGVPAAVVCALGSGGFCLIVIAAVPVWRGLPLKLAFLALLAGLVCRYADGAEDWVLTAIILLGAGLPLMTRLTWLDTLRLPGVLTSRAKRCVALSPDKLWQTLLPAETNAHWDPEVRGVSAGRLEGTFFYLFEARPRQAEVQIPIRLFDIEPPSFHLRGVDDVVQNAQERE